MEEMIKSKLLFSILLSHIFLLLCEGNSEYQLSEKNEIVMCKGMVITSVNKNGTITIEAHGVLRRKFKWNGTEVSVNMTPRDQRRDGSLGIYNPGGKKIHTVLEEGQQHFCSLKEATEWLQWQNDRMDYAASSNGLIVGWYFIEKTNKALCVELWQFYINGKKPSGFPINKHKTVSVFLGSGIEANPPVAGDFTPSHPKDIDGRAYSGKAVDIMEEKDIGPQDVENCIVNGKTHLKNGFTFYYITEPNIYWVMLDEDKRVVLVGK